MVSLKVICFFLVVSVVASSKVQLVCEDKSSFCSQEDKEKVCESDLSKLICRKTCDHCKCVDAESGFCQQDDICASMEGRLLCAKKCNACEFKMVDKPEEPKPDEKSPKEDLEKEKEKEEKEKEEKKKEEKKKEDKNEEEKIGKKVQEEREKQQEDKDKDEADQEDKDEKSTGVKTKVDAECVQHHNKYRGNHDETDNVEWDEKLAKGAEEWVKKITESGQMRHATQEESDNAGENLAMRGSSQAFTDSACQHAVANWYSEIKDFDFNTKSGRGTGHFTQVVWKKSKKIGCAVGAIKKGDMFHEYVVCRYMESGNWQGEYKSNVGDLKKGITMDDIKTQLKGDGVRDSDLPKRSNISNLLKKKNKTVL